MKRTLMIKAFVPSALGTMPLQVLATEHTITTGTEFATVLAATTHTAGDTFVVANDITLNTNKGNTSWRTAQATLTGANIAAATQSADINGVVTTFTSTETSQTDNGIDSAGLLTSIDNLVAAGNSNYTTVTVGTQNGIVVVAGQADTTMENLRYTGGAFTVYNNESGRVLGVANTATAIQNNSIDNNTVQVNGGLYAGSLIGARTVSLTSTGITAVEGNIISNNTVTANGTLHGGGMLGVS